MAVKKASTVPINRGIEPYNRLAAKVFLSWSQIRSTGLRCEHYLGKENNCRRGGAPSHAVTARAVWLPKLSTTSRMGPSG